MLVAIQKVKLDLEKTKILSKNTDSNLFVFL